MKKLILLTVSLFFLFSSLSSAAEEEIYEMEMKNISPHTKIYMIYDSSKDGVDEIGIEGPKQTFTLKSSESTMIQLKAGKYSIIEKIPSLRKYNSYEINVPEDFPKDNIIDFKRKKDILL